MKNILNYILSSDLIVDDELSRKFYCVEFDIDVFHIGCVCYIEKDGEIEENVLFKLDVEELKKCCEYCRTMNHYLQLCNRYILYKEILVKEGII